MFHIVISCTILVTNFPTFFLFSWVKVSHYFLYGVRWPKFLKIFYSLSYVWKKPIMVPLNVDTPMYLYFAPSLRSKSWNSYFLQYFKKLCTNVPNAPLHLNPALMDLYMDCCPNAVVMKQKWRKALVDSYWFFI